MVFAGSYAGVAISLNGRATAHTFGSTDRKFVTCIDEVCCATIGPLRLFFGCGGDNSEGDSYFSPHLHI